MASKSTKRCSTSLVFKGLQIQITVSSFFTPTRMTRTKKINNANVYKDVEKLEPSCIAGGNVK